MLKLTFVPHYVVGFTLLLLSVGSVRGNADEPFAFEWVASREEMVAALRARLPPGTPRTTVRRALPILNRVCAHRSGAASHG